tara:strand:- start:279 stop:518 length:240 start_codon:yes stop_codon:yes gene_type:complete
MSVHKYEIGQTVPYCVISKNKYYYGTAVIMSKTYISGAIIGYMVHVGKDIDSTNKGLYQDMLYQSEIDRGHVKFKKRSL